MIPDLEHEFFRSEYAQTSKPMRTLSTKEFNSCRTSVDHQTKNSEIKTAVIKKASFTLSKPYLQLRELFNSVV